MEQNKDVLPFGEQGEGVSVDSSGNVYSVGWADDAAGGADHFTIKYDADGSELWSKRYDSGGGGSNDKAYAVAIDASNNVIVTGTVSGNYFTIKYDSSGNAVWNSTLDAGGADSAYSIVIDDFNNTFIAGTADIVKYNSTLNNTWNSSFVGGTTHAITTDLVGNVYVTGNLNNDYLTAKYNRSGEQIWNRTDDDGGGKLW